jgi:hypothetical protein
MNLSGNNFGSNGMVSWQAGLNIFIHYTKHKISDRAITLFNKAGGIILLGFAGFSVYYALFNY